MSYEGLKLTQVLSSATFEAVRLERRLPEAFELPQLRPEEEPQASETRGRPPRRSSRRKPAG